MTKEQTAKMIDTLMTAYPNFHNGITGERLVSVVKLWHRYFRNVDTKIAARAIDEYILNNAYPPTISQIFDIIEDLK